MCKPLFWQKNFSTDITAEHAFRGAMLRRNMFQKMTDNR